MTHELKCWPVFFRMMRLGIKRFDIRKDDRGFRVGDHVVQREWDPETKKYSGARMEFRVVCMLRHEDFQGVAPGFVVMGLQ